MTASAEASRPRLLKIQEVAEIVGLTTRSIRYYEEIGLLRPAARSGGAYRLYDDSDLERLRFIKGLRDDAGFSLAEIGRLLEDEDARERNREAYQATADPAARRRIVGDSLRRVERQAETLRAKMHRLAKMVEEVEARRLQLVAQLGALDAGESEEAR